MTSLSSSQLSSVHPMTVVGRHRRRAPSWQSRAASTGLRAVAEEVVVAAAVIDGVHDDVVVFVATIVRTPNDCRRSPPAPRAVLAVQGGVDRSPSRRRRAPLSQLASLVHGVHDDVVHFVATIVRTPNDCRRSPPDRRARPGNPGRRRQVSEPSQKRLLSQLP